MTPDIARRRRPELALGFLMLMCFDTMEQIAFKLAGMHAAPTQADLAWLMRLAAEPWIYAALLGYIGAFFTWMHLLERARIGPAYAASHLEVVTVMLLSAWLFQEHVGASQIIGALLIVGGIVCLARAESAADRIERPDGDLHRPSPSGDLRTERTADAE